MDDFPGAFEQLTLMALARLGDGAYGMTVRREIAAATGRDVSLGAVYSTLDRLERKGWITSQNASAAGVAERGGRARRFFRLEPAGEAVLGRALDVLDSMRSGLVLPGKPRRGPAALPRPRVAGVGP